jgi:hypothetical protein
MILRRAAAVGTGLVLFLVVIAPLRAQQGEHKGGQQHAKPAGHARQARAPQQHARTARPAGHMRQAGAPQQHARTARPAGRVRPARTARVARGGYHGRIPAARFHSNFGRGHYFHMTRVIMVRGHRRFYYGGYWFVLGSPWPPAWAYTNNFYVDYINGGYYLCNPQYPSTQIAITVVL